MGSVWGDYLVWMGKCIWFVWWMVDGKGVLDRYWDYYRLKIGFYWVEECLVWLFWWNVSDKVEIVVVLGCDIGG